MTGDTVITEYDLDKAQTLTKIVVIEKDFKALCDSKSLGDYDALALNCSKPFESETSDQDTKNYEQLCCQPGKNVADVSKAYGVDLYDFVSSKEFSGASATSAVMQLPKIVSAEWNGLPQIIDFIGFGDYTLDDCRKAGLQLGRVCSGRSAVIVPFIQELDTHAQVSFFTGVLLACYRQTRIADKDSRKKPLEKLYVYVNDHEVAEQVALSVKDAHVIAEATILARTLECVPSNIKNPAWLADNFEKLINQTQCKDGELSIERIEVDQLHARGFNAITAVGQASQTPPCLAIVRWKPNKVNVKAPKIALVGKGITYDTGGLSLKPREYMVPMKTDMSGTATVVAAILAIAKAGLNVEVSAIACMAENAMGAASYRPGDVIRAYDGTTIEVVNTDAEGRMVLADGMGYAVKDENADIIVDIATLTGAATIGLGRYHAATYSNDDKVWENMLSSARYVGEDVWRMPLPDDYRYAMKSNIADLSHAEVDLTLGAGSVTAALFLEHFAKGRKWCHLDIAGVGRAGGNMVEVTQNQPTGFGAALLYQFVKHYDN